MEPSSTLEDPTTELTASLATPSTDRCPNCGSRMAVDQRYCIECGERRTGGGLRDALPRTQTVAPAAARPARRPLLSPSSSLIAGIATLLLAMGVGVLIGRSGDNGSTSKAAAPQVVTVSAGTGAANTSGASTAATAAAGAAAVKKASKKSKSSSSSKAVSGASSVDATAKKNGVKLPPKVVKIGQKCEKGAKGCQGGKFTGNFFGGG